MLTSESVALTALGYKIIRDIEPGEAIVIDRKGQVHSRCSARQTQDYHPAFLNLFTLLGLTQLSTTSRSISLD